MTSVDEILENATTSPPLAQSRNGGPPGASAGSGAVLVLALAFLAGVVIARLLTRRARVDGRA